MTSRRRSSSSSTFWRSAGAGAITLVLVLTGCASEPKDPAELREERVQQRIEDSFSRSQASCIMKVLDAPTIKALDNEGDLEADSEAMRIYSNAVVACAGAS